MCCQGKKAGPPQAITCKGGAEELGIGGAFAPVLVEFLVLTPSRWSLLPTLPCPRPTRSTCYLEKVISVDTW